MASKNWEEYASPDVKEMVKAIEADPNANSTCLEFAESLKAYALDQINWPHAHVLATPLLQIHNITLSSHPFLDLGLLLHTTVEFVDNDNQHYLLFDSHSTACDATRVLFSRPHEFLICLDNSPLNRPHYIHKYLSLKLRFVNTFLDTEMIDVCRLNFEPNVVYDQQQVLQLHTHAFGIVFVHYTYFRYATLAFVECKLLNKNDDHHVVANVSGAISARFKLRDELITRKLFNGPENLLLDDLAKLRWSAWLAVPAYSQLEFILDDLLINEDMIEDDTSTFKKLNFEPHHNYPKTVEILGQEWRFQVSVQWTHVFNYLPELVECEFAGFVPGSEEETTYLSEFEESDSETSGHSSRVSQSPPEKRPRLRLQSVEHSRSKANVMLTVLPTLAIYPQELVEVFSISVCPTNNFDNPFGLCGTIVVRDFFDEHEVFNRDKNTPDLLSPHQTITMVKPCRCYTGSTFSICLELEDSEGNEISHGYISWNFATARLDRRLCSIVRGKDGFAAVHYTIFSDAEQARVSVTFESSDDCEYQVHGKIRARYTGYIYSTQYDRKYYQSILFDKGKNELVTLRDGDSVPLSKLVVSVPLDESLIVFANLKLVDGGGREEILGGKVEFKAQRADEAQKKGEPLASQRIGESNKCGLIVSVFWG